MIAGGARTRTREVLRKRKSTRLSTEKKNFSPENENKKSKARRKTGVKKNCKIGFQLFPRRWGKSGIENPRRN